MLATRQTIASPRFARLAETWANGARILAQPCPGLVEQIERGELATAKTRELVTSFVRPLVDQGADTLVLGCTHYPFVEPVIASIAGPGVTLLNPAAAVARELQRRLAAASALAPATHAGITRFRTSGTPGTPGGDARHTGRRGRAGRERYNSRIPGVFRILVNAGRGRPSGRPEGALSMKPDTRLLSSTIGFVVLFALAAGAGSGLLAQRRSQAVVTPDDPIWAAAQDPPPQPQEPSQEPPVPGADPAPPAAARRAAAAVTSRARTPRSSRKKR